MRGRAAIYRLGGQNHELPDRRLRLLCLATWPCLHRPGALCGESVDRRSGPHEGSACSGENGLRNQACPGSRHDRTGHCRGRAFYGVGAVERALRRAGKGYVLGVASNHSVTSWGKAKLIAGTAESVAKGLAASDWKRLSAGDGAKGPRLYDWAYVELADLDASDYEERRSGLWTRGLLIRRTIADQELAFFSTWAPVGTSIEKLVRVEGCRWAIEDSFETAKNELGLDHNETRSWHGWHRHVSLVMLAFAMMATIRHRANNAPAQPKRGRACEGPSRWRLRRPASDRTKARYACRGRAETREGGRKDCRAFAAGEEACGAPVRRYRRCKKRHRGRAPHPETVEG